MIRLATRKSPLALQQAAMAAERITAQTGERVEIIPLSSLGDEDQIRPLARFLQPGAFTGRLDQALQDDEADLAVHSLKDVPLRPPEGITRTYVLERIDPADRLVHDQEVDPAELDGMRVGTSAPRRQSQLGARHPDAIAIDVRGSIGTRLQRIPDGELDALFVAAAALQRGEDKLPNGTTAVRLPLDAWPTAPGQGALALQAKKGTAAEAVLAAVEDPMQARAVEAERGLLADLGGGCGTPLGATCLPPGHPEGDAALWTLYVTYPDAHGALRAFTIREADPETCRREAQTNLARPESRRTPADHTANGKLLLVMDPETATPWRNALQDAGYSPLHWWPFVTVDLMTDPEVHAQAGAAFADAEWVLVTSARAVPACRRLHQESGALPRFAAVGPATARALRTEGLPVTLVPPVARGDEIVHLLARRAERDGARRLLWLSGTDVTEATLEALGRSSLQATRIAVYGLEATTAPPLPQGRLTAILFASPRAVQHARPLLSGHPDAPVFAIGGSSAAALREVSLRPIPLPRPTPNAFIALLNER